MKIRLNKSHFIDNILLPVSKISDNLLIDFESLEQENTFNLKTFVSSSDNSTLLLAKIPCAAKNPSKAIIPDCKTFLRLFSGIEKDTVELNVDSNVIVYQDDTFSFKYYLLDESYIVNKKSISEEKIKGLDFDINFEVSKQKFSEILKYNSIVPEAEKLYFYTKDSKVYIKIGDEQKSNTNEIVTKVAESFDGSAIDETIPVNIQNLLLFTFSENKIKININKKLKILKFETPQICYVVSGLVK